MFLTSWDQNNSVNEQKLADEREVASHVDQSWCTTVYYKRQVLEPWTAGQIEARHEETEGKVRNDSNE